MINRRNFLRSVACAAGAVGMMSAATPARSARRRAAVPGQIKAFCIDFDSVHGKFAPPGHWGDASPTEHVAWYEALGANVIQTFAVSSNGYAWYKRGFVPPQPGLKHDFLPEVVRIAHKKGMLAMGYFCIGGNEKWSMDHPDLGYLTPSNKEDINVPFTDEYLDYLSQMIGDAIKKTGMDGTMLDWVWNPSGYLRQKGWLPTEQKLFTQLTSKPFPANGQPAPEDMVDYERRAINRVWARIKETRDKANPKCILWLSVSDLSKPSIQDSPMLREVDWLMNESPDAKLYEIGKRMAGPETRMIQNLVGWADHDAKNFLANPNNRGLNLYGFAEPRENSLPLPMDEYLRQPVDAFKGKDRRSVNNYNIAALARFYRGMPMDSVLP